MDSFGPNARFLSAAEGGTYSAYLPFTDGSLYSLPQTGTVGGIDTIGPGAQFEPLGGTGPNWQSLTLSRTGAAPGELGTAYGFGEAYPFADLNYPPFMGTYGPMTMVQLQPGTVISRIGRLESPFVSPAGTPLSMRGLPIGNPGVPESLFTVQEPIYVIQGQIAPWNGSPGGGVQWILPDNVNNLVGGPLK